MSEYVTMPILISQKDSRPMHNFKDICRKCSNDKERKILKIKLDSQSVEGKIKNMIEYFDFVKKSYSLAKFGIFYNFKEADEFMRTTGDYTRIQVAEGYDAPDSVSSAWRLTITFKYNQKFCEEIKNFVTFYAINDRECLEILDSLEASQTPNPKKNKSPQNFGNTAHENKSEVLNTLTTLSLKTAGLSATYLVEDLKKEVINLKQIKEQLILLIPTFAKNQFQYVGAF